jgi:hypothetical protein
VRWSVLAASAYDRTRPSSQGRATSTGKPGDLSIPIRSVVPGSTNPMTSDSHCNHSRLQEGLVWLPVSRSEGTGC